MSAKDLLDKIQIQNPCTADWDSMIGNDQVRFCEHCSLTVHDLSQMTRKRARSLVAKSNGRLCVRYKRRADGSVVTRAVPQKLFRIGRRASRIAAGAFSATLSLTSAVANSSNERFNLNESSVATASQDPSRQVYQGGTIAGTITDPNGAVIAGATISLSNDQTRLALFSSSNSNGEYRFEGLEPGLYSLRIEAQGFDPGDLGAYLAANITQRADMNLEVATIREEVEIQGNTEVRQTRTMGVVAMVVEPAESLIKAAQDDNLEALEALLTRSNVNVRDKNLGTTALECAVENGNREMVQVLLSAGADVKSRNRSKETVLMMPGEETTADIIWDLINAGAKVDLKDDEGDTALIEAAMERNLPVLTALLHAGAKVDARNDAGQTALMLAASNDQIANVRALIRAGADMNARDKEGKTVLDYAIKEDHEKIIKLLQSYGAITGEKPKAIDSNKDAIH